MQENKSKTRKVFIEELPRFTEGRYKSKINWLGCMGCKIYFIYDNIEGYIEIIGYDIENSKLTIKYLENITKITTTNFAKCQLGQVLGKITRDFKVKIGTRFQDDKRDITIIDRKVDKDKYETEWKYYKYRCNKCSFDCREHWSIKDKEYKEELWIEENMLLSRKQGCSSCSGHIVVEGINDIPTTAPELIQYFSNGYEDSKKYTKSSKQKINPVCPNCGKIKEKSMSICTIYKQGISCSCSDGFKYPNKFALSVLEQLGLDFETEFTPEWIKPRRYDFYVSSINKIIEMDGALGHGNKKDLEGRNSTETKEIDDYKDKLAQEHGIEVIRIDCDYDNNDRFQYIKNNILKSNLSKLFDLSKINWEKAEEFALSNLVKVACDYKNNNSELTTLDIANLMHLHRATIIRYLKQGTEVCWCNYDAKNEIRKAVGNNGKMGGNSVKVFKDNFLLGVFQSVSELSKQSIKIFGTTLIRQNISEVCKGIRKEYKGFTFEYA